MAVFYRDIDLVAKKAGRKQYFIVTRSPSLEWKSSPFENVLKYFLAFRVFSIGRFLTTLLYWKGMFDMLDSFSEWYVPIYITSSSLPSFTSIFFNYQVCASVLGHPRCLPSLHPWSFQERRHHTSGHHLVDCQHHDLIGFDGDDGGDGKDDHSDDGAFKSATITSQNKHADGFYDVYSEDEDDCDDRELSL